MPSPSTFQRLAVTRPAFPLLVGYGLTSLLLALLVTVQSGVAAGFGSALANLVIFLPAVGIHWVIGMIVARRASAAQAWWVTRAEGYLLGFIVVVSVAFVPLYTVVPQLRREADAAGGAGTALVAGIVAVLALVNGLPLLIALLVERWGRKRLPAGVSSPTAP